MRSGGPIVWQVEIVVQRPRQKQLREQWGGEDIDSYVPHFERKCSLWCEETAESESHFLLGGYKGAKPRIECCESLCEITIGSVKLSRQNIGFGHREPGAFSGEKGRTGCRITEEANPSGEPAREV